MYTGNIGRCFIAGRTVDDYAEHYNSFHKTDSYRYGISRSFSKYSCVFAFTSIFLILYKVGTGTNGLVLRIRIRDPDPGSGAVFTPRIRDPGCFYPGSRIRPIFV
jgi:hypothetical protein